MMDDLISRQAVINVLDKNHILGRGDLNEVLDHIVDRLEKLPSAHPEPCVDTIDALNESIKHFDDMAEECRRNANIERNDYMDMRDDAAEYRQLSIWLNELKWLRERFQSQPEHTNSWCINSWCIDCKEYDTENKCCPRYNRVIRQTLDEVYAHAETEAEARFHAQQRWIPCSERLPAYGEDVLISIGGYCNVGYIVSVNEEEQYNWYFSGWYHLPNDVDAWMPLPEPYAERRTDEQTVSE